MAKQDSPKPTPTPKPKEVTIHIDKKKKTSPNPSTGAALYVLGEVPASYDLWQETKGPGDDKMILNDATPVKLKNGDQFYSAQSTLNPGS